MRVFPLLLLASSLWSHADYQVDANLGALTPGVVQVSGTTAAVEIDPGPPPVVIGGRNNASFARGLTLVETLNWGNEFVMQFEVKEPSIISLTSITIEGDPDFFLLESLATEFDPNLSKEVATGAIGLAYLDGEPPTTETIATIRPGVYYLSVENFDGPDGNLTPGDSSFSIGISINSASRQSLAIDLGAIALTNEPFTLDTAGSAFDTAVAVYDQDGQLLTQNDNAPNSTHSLITFDQGLPSGIYFVVLAGGDVSFGPNLVVTPGGETGDWVLNFPPNGNYPSGSEQKATASGSEDTESQIFFFNVSPPPIDWIDLGQVALVDEVFTIDTLGSDIDTVIGLFDRKGTFLTANDDISAEVLQSALTFRPGLAAGDYFLAVGGFPTVFNDGFAAFMAPEADTTESGRVVLNHPEQGGVAAKNIDIASGEQQWFRFTVVENYSEDAEIKIVSIDFDPEAQQFTVAWESDLPGPFNIHVGTAAELEAAALTPDTMLDLALSGVVNSPAVVTVPPSKQGARQLFLQVAR